jgi:hypothetical protein
MGRLVDLHPETDGLTRVASVKTINGEYKRCVKKNSSITNRLQRTGTYCEN